ncbi:MSLNL protein, partial [Climacteris rufus]|nr:MSLNL protein [Climacteris rufus]
AQLSCLARLLAAKNLTADFGSFPPDLLLFNPSEVRAGSCREFYGRASRGKLELLARGSARRTRLLRGALSCLVSGVGWPGTPTLLLVKPLRGAGGSSPSAGSAPRAGGSAPCGPGTQHPLSLSQHLCTFPAPLSLSQHLSPSVPQAAREGFRRSFSAAYSSQSPSQREKSLILLRALAAASAPSPPRLKRSSGRCLSQPITASSIADSILFFDYDTPEQFDLCLSNKVFLENLEALLAQPLPTEYSLVLKKKMDQMFPGGIPEEQLRRLGPLSRLYSEEEMGGWAVTSGRTLAALLSPSGGAWRDSQVQQLLSTCLARGGSLTGPLLREIGGKRLCNLQEEQIQLIPAEALGTAGHLNISSCSQAKKEQLYRKAREAFASLAGTPGRYYCQIRPFLGGAPAEDLKDLANAGVAIDMDLGTFLALNPKELQKLSVTDVKNLLGEHLPELKEAENESLVMSWVQRQSQRELDCVLGIGLQGGLQEPTGTTPPPHPSTSASATSLATVPVPTTLSTVPSPPNPSTSASATPMATTPVPTTLSTVPSPP